MSTLSVNDVKKKYEAKIMKIPGVVGIGIGKENDNDVIKVLVAEQTALIDKKVPKQLKGFPVVVQVTGTIKAL